MVEINEASKVMRHKTCLVVKGYVQCIDIDFNRLFVSVTRLESVRMMVVLAAHH
jgi:hypothetical protein